MSHRDLRAGVRRLFRLDLHRPDEAPADADAELASLLEETTLDLMRRGLPEAEARREAVRRLGTPVAVASTRLHHSAGHRERRLRLLEWIEDAGADVRYAVRSLRQSPALAGAAVLTLALAIGANTAIFSAVSAVILRPLPYREPDRLVMLWEENPEFGWHQQTAAPANMLDWKEQAGVFTDVAAYLSFGDAMTLTGQGEPRLLRALAVTGNFFTVLGVPAELGRTFTDAETWSGGPPVVMLSHQAWRDVFGGDPTLVGKTVQLDGAAREVVGVLPERFTVPGITADVWTPVGWDPASRARVFFRRAHWVWPVARLGPGVTEAAATAALQTVVRRLQHDYPATNRAMGAGMTPLHEFLVGETKQPLLVTFGAVVALLLIACANVANLLLVRAAGRARETAVRLALGAGRGRLIRQALAESAVVAGLGGLAGLWLGWWGTGALARLQPAGMLPIADLPVSWPVLLYVSLVTGLAALFFGLAPTLWSGARVPADVLRDEGRTSTGATKARRSADLLLAGQVALALVLTLGAGLLVRSYLRLRQVDPGFDAANVLTVRLTLPGTSYDDAGRVTGFADRLVEETGALPGVLVAGVASKVPLGPSSWTSEFAVEGQAPFQSGVQVVHREASPGYFEVMRVPVLRGRAFTALDRADSPPVVLINETLARTYFPAGDPIGRRVSFDRVPDSSSLWRTIVGVVGDERQNELAAAPEPEFFAPFAQDSRQGFYLTVRTDGDPTAVGPAIRRVVGRLDPDLAISSMVTMEGIRAVSLGRERFLTTLLLLFAGVGVILGLVGIYGLVAQVARRRTREMGIRMALGAKRGAVQWLVVRHGLVVTTVGLAVGVAGALAAGGALRNLLYEVAPGDPLVFLTMPALVLVVAGLASWLPAARASRTDPTVVLREE